MQRVYAQCSLGHYSAGGGGCVFCPAYPARLPDNLLGDRSSTVAVLTIEELIATGTSSDVLSDLILLDFGAPASAFEGMIAVGFQGPDGVIRPWDPSFPEGFGTAKRSTLYIRCNGGEYFSETVSCPFDGWWREGIAEAQERFAASIGRGVVPRPHELVSGPRGAELLPRLVVAQFGDARKAVRGIIPMIYQYQGVTSIAQSDVPLALL